MLDSLRRRLARRGLADRIETHCCAESNAWLEGRRESMDKAVLIYVLHEVPDLRQTLAEVHAVLRTGGALLLVEPKRHRRQRLGLGYGLGLQTERFIVRPPSLTLKIDSVGWRLAPKMASS
jgi:ubiquinone/menaquinone biosynthesis C-methylase UbiE